MARQDRVWRGRSQRWYVVVPPLPALDHNLFLSAHAVFDTPANASEAVNKLHAHVFKGSLLSATLKKRLDGLAKAAAAKKAKPAAKSSQQKGVPAPNRASRLIVRNLPFDITEQDLRAIFLPYGPIYSVHIPLAAEAKQEEDVKAEQDQGDSKHTIQRSKGFAFVWFLSRKDAEKAMEGCNGMTVEAGMAEKLVTDKQKKKKQLREEKKRKANDGEHVEGGEDDEEREGGGRRRIIAVDWALSKDKWEAEKAKLQAQEDEDEETSDGEGSGEDEDEVGDRSEGSEVGESDSEDEQLGVHERGSAESDSEGNDSQAEDESDEEEQTPAKPTLPPPEVGTTAFVRNVPFEATDDELRTL